jgi:hypothetical protein
MIQKIKINLISGIGKISPFKPENTSTIQQIIRLQNKPKLTNLEKRYFLKLLSNTSESKMRVKLHNSKQFLKSIGIKT